MNKYCKTTMSSDHVSAMVPCYLCQEGNYPFTYIQVNQLSSKLKESTEQRPPKVLRQDDNLDIVIAIIKPNQKLAVLKLKGN